MTALRAHALVLLLCGCSLPGCAALLRHDDSVATDGSRPSLAQKHHDRGVKLAKQGKLDRAEIAFQEAIIADAAFGPAHNNLGLVQFEKRDLHSAAWSFQRAIELLPSRAEPLNNLGLTYEAAWKLDEAVDQYLAAVNLAPDNAEYFGNLIRARLKRGESDESLDFDLARLLSIDTRPDWIDWAKLKLVMIRRQRPTQNATDELLPAPAPSSGTSPEPTKAGPPPLYQGELPPPWGQNEPRLPDPQHAIDAR